MGRPGQKDRAAPSLAGRIAGGLAFTVVAATAMGILAAVVLLPGYYRRCLACADREALAAHVSVNDQLIEYNERLIEAVKTDTVLTQRLLMQQQGYRRPGEIRLVMADAPADPPITAMLAARVPQTSYQPPPTVERLAQSMQDPRTRHGLLLLAAVLLTAAMILFAPDDSLPKRSRTILRPR